MEQQQYQDSDQQQINNYRQQNSQICTLSNLQQQTKSTRGWFVIVKIKDFKVEFQVDTGADANILSRDAAEKLGLSVHAESTNTAINTFNGQCR